jgi:hypothetical protein
LHNINYLISKRDLGQVSIQGPILQEALDYVASLIRLSADTLASTLFCHITSLITTLPHPTYSTMTERPSVVGPDNGPEAPFPYQMEGKVISGFGRGSKEVRYLPSSTPPS